MKKLSIIFGILTLVLSHVTCAVVAYTYCNLFWCGQYGGCSAPASTAFILAISYGIAIAACAILSTVFYKKSKKQP